MESGNEGTVRHAGKNLLRGVNLDGLLEIGRSSSGALEERGNWTPPEIAELAESFPTYELLKFVGRGGMGAVYLARHRSLDRRVAIKLLPPTACQEEAFVQRFHREARTLARLYHPGIVTVHDFGTTRDGLLFLAMEYVDGVPLSQLIREGRLSVPEVLEIVKQICDSLAYAHAEGVIHRDIKPDNILLDQRGRVKVADFGLAKLAEQEPDAFSMMHTHPGAILGTPAYAAPEQMKAHAKVDQRADIYSLGILLYEMLTGDVPHGVFEPPSRKRDSDVRLDQVTFRAMQEKPEQRYQQVSEMRDDVTKVQAGPRSVRRAAWVVPGVITLGVLGLVTVALLVWPGRKDPLPSPASAALEIPAPLGPIAADYSPAPTLAEPQAQQPPTEATFAGRRFRYVSQPATWQAAEAQARKLGGRLASATSVELNTWLTTTFATQTPVLLGGQCGLPGGAWEWVDGSPWSYEAWSGAGPIYGAVRLNPDGLWTAASFDQELPYIVTFE